jgi:TatD DNase family protein
MIDCHCHLTSRKYEDVGEVVRRAKEAGVKKIITAGSNLKDSKRVIEITEGYKEVYGVVGVSPGEKFVEIEVFKELLKNEKVVGIGEIGLDLYWNKIKIEEEKTLFKKQLELAVEVDKPVVIHNRLAKKEIREVFSQLKTLPRGMFHCWSGDEDFLKYVLERGFFVSLAGNITYKSNGDLLKVAKKAPLERILIESDGPYLSPEGKRGEINEPGNVRITAQFLADEFGKTFEKIEEVININVKSLFNI